MPAARDLHDAGVENVLILEARDRLALQRPQGRILFGGADAASNWIGWLEGRSPECHPDRG